MPLALLPELSEVRDMLRKFTQCELDPISDIIDKTGDVPPIAREVLHKHGFLGMRLDPAHGGSGASLAQYCLALEEFSRSNRVFTLIMDATSGLTPMAIQQHGTAAQKAKYLPGLSDGTAYMAFGLTEPDAGSDSASMRTRAVRGDGGWIINGRKHFINGGDIADSVMVMTVTDPEKRARGGISAFIVDRGTPGFSVTRVDQTMGSEAVRLAELTFEDCFVPDTALLGEAGDGFKIAMGSLTKGRLGVASSCIGVSDKLIEMCVEQASVRTTFGQKLSERQAIQWMIADSAAELTAARALTYQTITQYEEGNDVGSAASMCKLLCSEMVGRIADRAVQVHGGMGIVRGFKVERFYRDIRHYRIGEGTSEMQRMLIARDMFKNGRVTHL
jgi:acyl-CoA dehydrogenase